MTRRSLSPLERRALVALISLIRDKESDPDEWACTEIRLSDLYDRLYLPGDRSWGIERRNQRQSQRRALGRLHGEGLINAIALAWVNIEDEQVLRWQGGGKRAVDVDGFRSDTPAKALDTCQTWPPRRVVVTITQHPSRSLRLRKSGRGTSKVQNPPVKSD